MYDAAGGRCIRAYYRDARLGHLGVDDVFVQASIGQLLDQVPPGSVSVRSVRERCVDSVVRSVADCLGKRSVGCDWVRDDSSSSGGCVATVVFSPYGVVNWS